MKGSVARGSKEGLVEFPSFWETEARGREAAVFEPMKQTSDSACPGDLRVCMITLKEWKKSAKREGCSAAYDTFTEIMCQGNEGKQQ